MIDSAKGIESGNWKQKPLLLRRRIMRVKMKAFLTPLQGLAEFEQNKEKSKTE